MIARRPRHFFAMKFASLIIVTVSASLAMPQPPGVDPAVLAAEQSRIDVVQKVLPAVCAVCKYGGGAAGSGVIIDPEGYALTNVHVVSGTGPVLSCGLSDNQLYDAVLVGLDRVGDVALIKLLPKEKGKPFPFVKLGDSDTVKPGDWSLAMGNPFGVAQDFTPTVTYGLVSGTNRYQPPAPGGFLEYTDCIQVDTSINPGNSGGPLFNMKGELVGINGRISLEKRGRVNVGVGYAISINQIKNFLGHLYAGLDTDHATLGAIVGAEDEDKQLNKLVVKEVRTNSDADRRQLQEGDHLMRFGTTNRFMSTTNQYKNILGIYPKGWRVPLSFKREGEPEKEILVRLESLQPPPLRSSVDEPEPKDRRPLLPGSTPGSQAAELYKPKKGYANWHFNEIEQNRVLDGLKKHGDYAAVPGQWTADGTFAIGERNGAMHFEISDNKGADGSPLVVLKTNTEQSLQPLKDSDPAKRSMPLGSGGLMMALYHWHHFLTQGPKGFEKEFVHAGSEPLYPRPTDGSVPKSLASLLVETDVIHTQHGAVEGKWYFSKKDHLLLAFEITLAKDTDPCEVYLGDYKMVDGRMMPHRFEVRNGDALYGVLNVTKYNLAK